MTYLIKLSIRHLVRDVSRALTSFLASRQAWPKILGGKFRCLGGRSFVDGWMDRHLRPALLCRRRPKNGAIQ